MPATRRGRAGTSPPVPIQVFGNAHNTSSTTVAASATLSAGSLVLAAWAGTGATPTLKSALGNVVGDVSLLAAGGGSYALWLFTVDQPGAETLTVTSTSDPMALNCIEIGNWSQVDLGSLYPGATGSGVHAFSSGASGTPMVNNCLAVGVLAAGAASSFAAVPNLLYFAPALVSETDSIQGSGLLACVALSYGALTAAQGETYAGNVSGGSVPPWGTWLILVDGDDGGSGARQPPPPPRVRGAALRPAPRCRL